MSTPHVFDMVFELDMYDYHTQKTSKNLFSFFQKRNTREIRLLPLVSAHKRKSANAFMQTGFNFTHGEIEIGKKL